jgi:hypothetical protein
MLKDGYKHMSGLDEAVYRNIDACKSLSQITRTSMGPNGELNEACPLSSPSLMRCAYRQRRNEQDGHQPSR